jgi:hypothetical protein
MYYPTRWKYDLDRPPARAPYAADDEFDQATLDPKWTVVNGSAGTISLFATDGGTYDLTTRPGWLLMQPDLNHEIRIQQTYTLPDGYSVITALAPSLVADGQSGIADNELDFGLTISNVGGEYYTIHFDGEADGWRIYSATGTANSSLPPNVPACPIAQLIYLRIARVGLDYYGSWSADGHTWMPFVKQTFAAEATTLVLFATVDRECADPTPIQAIAWLRIGGSGVQPW